MFANGIFRTNPAYGRQGACFRRRKKTIDYLNIRKLVVRMYGREIRKRVPDTGNLGLERAGNAILVTAYAIRLVTFGQVIGPPNVIFIE